VRVAAVDADGDGLAEVVAAPGPGGNFGAVAVNPTTLQPEGSANPFAGFRGGVFVGGNG
jgi:hypothetical protein